MPSLTLGPFQLVAQLGRGGMATVFEATHRSGQRVAVKVVDPFRATDPAFAGFFAREVASVATLSHPHVLQVFDQGSVPTGHSLTPGTPWLAMELCSAGSWKDRRGQASWDELRPGVEQLLSALAHAHSRGVIHRDVKPDNVLLAGRESLQPGVRLADFGIAWAPRTGDVDDRSLAIGTPSYSAPEQFLADRDPVPASDLYAVACSIWAVLTGIPPMTEGSAVQTLLRRQEFRLEDLAAVHPVPPGLRGWLAWLLEPDPRRRPPDAATAAAALHHLGGDRLALALPSDWRHDAPAPPPRWLHDVGQGLLGLRTPPLMGRADLQDALWGELKTVAGGGSRRLVVLLGDRGTGRGRLATWLAERAHQAGFPVVRDLGDWGDEEVEQRALGELARSRGAWLYVARAPSRWAPPAELPLPVRALRVPALGPTQLRTTLAEAFGLSASLSALIAEHCGGSVSRAQALITQQLEAGRLESGRAGLTMAPGAQLALPPSHRAQRAQTLDSTLRRRDWPAVEVAASLGGRPDLELWGELTERAGVPVARDLFVRLVRSGVVKPERGGWRFADPESRLAVIDHALRAGRWVTLRSAAADLLAERRPGDLLPRIACLLDARRTDDAAALLPALLGDLNEHLRRHPEGAAMLQRGAAAIDEPRWNRYARYVELSRQAADGRESQAMLAGCQTVAAEAEAAGDRLLACYALRAASRARRSLTGPDEVTERLQQRALRHAEASGDVRARMLALLSLAWEAADSAGYVDAERYLRTAMALVDEPPADALTALAMSLSRQGRMDEARAALERALRVAEARGNVDQHGRAASMLAAVLLRQGDHEAAIPVAQQVVDEARRRRELDALSVRLINLGEALRRVGRGAEAERCYRESLALSLGHRPTTAMLARGNLGILEADRGRFASAVEHLSEAVSLSDRSRGPDSADHLRVSLLWPLAEVGGWAEWDALVDRLSAGAFARLAQDVELIEHLGKAAAALGRQQQAERFERLSALTEALQDRPR